jgi:hypothetical protein
MWPLGGVHPYLREPQIFAVEVELNPLAIKLHLLKVTPDPPVAATVVGSAHRGALLVDPTTLRREIDLVAVTVAVVPVVIGPAKLPLQQPRLDLLGAQCEREPTANGLTDVEALRAIHCHSPPSLRGVIDPDGHPERGNISALCGLGARRLDAGAERVRLHNTILDEIVDQAE